MKDHRNNPSWEEHKNQGPRKKDDEGRGSVEEVGQQTPQERLKDGTNDFQNGDQDDLGEASEKPSAGNESQTA